MSSDLFWVAIVIAAGLIVAGVVRGMREVGQEAHSMTPGASTGLAFAPGAEVCASTVQIHVPRSRRR